MFRKSPVAIGWIVVFLAVPVVILLWELARGTYANPTRHAEHLLLVTFFLRGLFELYGYLKSRKLANGDAGSA
ncbi:MAG: hypothetical protein ABI373_04660 [Flavobacteriales bacterium]